MPAPQVTFEIDGYKASIPGVDPEEFTVEPNATGTEYVIRRHRKVPGPLTAHERREEILEAVTRTIVQLQGAAMVVGRFHSAGITQPFEPQVAVVHVASL